MLIAYMAGAGFAAFALEWLAHQAMKGRTYITPVPRYAVGVALAGVPWTAAALTALVWPVSVLECVLTVSIGFWWVFALAGLGTWLGYEADKKPATESDLARFARFVTGEHTDGSHERD